MVTLHEVLVLDLEALCSLPEKENPQKPCTKSLTVPYCISNDQQNLRHTLHNAKSKVNKKLSYCCDSRSYCMQ